MRDRESALHAGRGQGILELISHVDVSLHAAIESALGLAPELEVVSREERRPPHPEWLAECFSARATLLVRCTRYRTGSTILSMNVAYLDPGRIHPDLLSRLEAGEVTLRDVLFRDGLERSLLGLGTSEDARWVHRALHGCFAEEADTPYLWRRYTAPARAPTAFMVIESLPMQIWERLLPAPRAEGDPEGGVA